jgi:hypothetical protein
MTALMDLAYSTVHLFNIFDDIVNAILGVIMKIV